MIDVTGGEAKIYSINPDPTRPKGVHSQAGRGGIMYPISAHNSK
jgi:hypothetical protein